MGRLIKSVVIIALLYCGWWALLSFGMARGIDALQQDLAAQGWQVTARSRQSSGFPAEVCQRLEGIEARGPQAGLTLPEATLCAKTYWPGHAHLRLSDDQITVLFEGEKIFVRVRDGQAVLRLRPSLALELQQVVVQSGAWQVNTSAGNVMAAADLRALVNQIGTAPGHYDFEVSAGSFAPGDLLRAALFVPSETPVSFDALQTTGRIRLSQALDRHLAQSAAPQITELVVQSAKVQWGALGFETTAQARIDPQGVPEGALNARLRNWQAGMDLAEGAGIITAEQRAQSQLMLNIFAGMSGDPSDIDVKAISTNGQLTVNGIALGPTPPLFAP